MKYICASFFNTSLVDRFALYFFEKCINIMKTAFLGSCNSGEKFVQLLCAGEFEAPEDYCSPFAVTSGISG